MDQFSVPVLADQDVRLAPPIGQRHHELPAVPERNDDMPAFAVEPVNRLGSLGPDSDRLAQESDQAFSDRRQ